MVVGCAHRERPGCRVVHYSIGDYGYSEGDKDRGARLYVGVVDSGLERFGETMCKSKTEILYNNLLRYLFSQ